VRELVDEWCCRGLHLGYLAGNRGSRAIGASADARPGLRPVDALAFSRSARRHPAMGAMVMNIAAKRSALGHAPAALRYGYALLETLKSNAPVWPRMRWSPFSAINTPNQMLPLTAHRHPGDRGGEEMATAMSITGVLRVPFCAVPRG